MRIKDVCFQREEKSKLKLDLINLIEQPSDKQERPCPGCRLTFDGDPSILSTKNCSYKCSAAPAQMSADPTRYPIEFNVVPIVYALYTLRLLMPCWSCEGHLDASGRISKLPKVWFYSVSPFFPKLIAQFIGKLRSAHKLDHDWNVSILSFSQSMFSITYSIEPKWTSEHDASLVSLQSDMLVIAGELRLGVLGLARDYITKADRTTHN